MMEEPKWNLDYTAKLQAINARKWVRTLEAHQHSHQNHDGFGQYYRGGGCKIQFQIQRTECDGAFKTVSLDSMQNSVSDPEGDW